MHHVTMLSLVHMLLLLMEIALGLELMIAIELLRVAHVIDWVCVEVHLLLLLMLQLLRLNGWCKHNTEKSRDIVFYLAVQRQAHCFQHR